MADQKGRFLFEIRPDIFPEGFLCQDEIALWGLYYEYKQERTSDDG